MVKEGQMAPMHFHWNKMEDIINRGGGNVLITVYNSTAEGGLADTPVIVHMDGVKNACRLARRLGSHQGRA